MSITIKGHHHGFLCTGLKRSPPGLHSPGHIGSPGGIPPYQCHPTQGGSLCVLALLSQHQRPLSQGDADLKCGNVLYKLSSGSKIRNFMHRSPNSVQLMQYPTPSTSQMSIYQTQSSIASASLGTFQKWVFSPHSPVQNASAFVQREGTVTILWEMPSFFVWPCSVLYAYPLKPLILKMISRLKKAQVIAILAAPAWLYQVWSQTCFTSSSECLSAPLWQQISELRTWAPYPSPA